MAEAHRDPAIKLFGKTIQLLPDEALSKPPSNDEQQRRHHPSTSLHQKSSQEEQIEARGEDPSSHQFAEGSIDQSTSSRLNEDPKTPNAETEISSTNTNKSNDPNEMIVSKEKTELKKPDKLLPCPRCNSMDTKFCYYNNYKANQPRHFCKNCQRYWTAGGTMRNVPVGSGRRKSKSSSASHYRHIIVSEPLQVARTDGIHHQSVLTFGSDPPLCESMASVLNLAENIAEKCQNVSINESSRQEKKNKDDHLAASKGENGTLNNFQGYPLQVPCFPAPPWPYPWNSAQYRSTVTPSTLTPFGPTGFPMPFYPPPQHWGCTVPPGPWSMSWLTPQNPFPPLTPQNPFPGQYVAPSSSSSPLRKHSRDGNLLTSSNLAKEQASEGKDQERAVLIPKTLRINDPNEAAKSSIWSTLGIKNDNGNSIKGGSLFKAFEPKGNKKNHFDEKSTVLHANPAALSRSLNFHESS